MDPGPLLGGKNFHQSVLRLSPAGGAGGVEERKRSRVGLGGPPTGGRKGCPQKGKEEEKSKGKDGSGP